MGFLPAVLWVGSMRYEIYWDPETWSSHEESTDVHAWTSWKKGMICFNPRLPESVHRETFFHEMLHAVFEATGDWNATPNPADEFHVFEEHIVGRLSPWLHSVMTDPRNQEVIAWLVSS